MRLSTLFLGDSPNWGRIPKQPCNKVPKLLCTSTKARELIGFTVGVAIGMIRSMILGLVSSLNVVTLGGVVWVAGWIVGRLRSPKFANWEYWHCVRGGYEVDRRDHERKVEMSF
jgi:hypothetical protein